MYDVIGIDSESIDIMLMTVYTIHTNCSSSTRSQSQAGRQRGESVGLSIMAVDQSNNKVQ